MSTWTQEYHQIDDAVACLSLRPMEALIMHHVVRKANRTKSEGAKTHKGMLPHWGAIESVSDIGRRFGIGQRWARACISRLVEIGLLFRKIRTGFRSILTVGIDRLKELFESRNAEDPAPQLRTSTDQPGTPDVPWWVVTWAEKWEIAARFPGKRKEANEAAQAYVWHAVIDMWGAFGRVGTPDVQGQAILRLWETRSRAGVLCHANEMLDQVRRVTMWAQCSRSVAARVWRGEAMGSARDRSPLWVRGIFDSRLARATEGIRAGLRRERQELHGDLSDLVSPKAAWGAKKREHWLPLACVSPVVDPQPQAFSTQFLDRTLRLIGEQVGPEADAWERVQAVGLVDTLDGGCAVALEVPTLLWGRIASHLERVLNITGRVCLV